MLFSEKKERGMRVRETRMKPLRLCVVRAPVPVLASVALAGVKLERNTAVGTTVKYSYAMSAFVGPISGELRDTGEGWTATCEFKFLPDLKVQVVVSDMKLANATLAPEGIDASRVGDIRCAVVASLDSNGRVTEVSSAEFSVTEPAAFPNADMLELGGRLEQTAYQCIEMALWDLPLVERGPGQSWICTRKEWQKKFLTQPRIRMFPFDVLRLDAVEDEKVALVGHSVTFSPNIGSLVPSQEWMSVPGKGHFIETTIIFDMALKAARESRLTIEFEFNRPDEALGVRTPYGGVYVGKTEHVLTLMEQAEDVE